MQVSIAINDPPLLIEAEHDQHFLVRTVELQECVCARATHGLDSVVVRHGTDLVMDTVVEVFGHKAAEEYRRLRECIDVVVIGCRVGRSEPGYVCTGTVLSLPPTTPVQFVELVEKPAFRERVPKATEQQEARA